MEWWAEVRRMHRVDGLSIREIHRRTGLHRETIRRALRSSDPPRYSRPPRSSKLDPFVDEIDRLLRTDPRLPGKRVRELLGELGYAGGKTILDDYLRELLPRRTYQGTVYRPGELLQFDLWEPRGGDPGRLRPDAPRLGRDLHARVVARDRRGAAVLEGGP